jgi:transposase-like protein
MKTSRIKFTGAFKAEVAIEALKERLTLAELSQRYGVHSAMISKWKQEFINRAGEIFETRAPEEETEREKERLYAKIGQLEMERDWLKKISKKMNP